MALVKVYSHQRESHEARHVACRLLTQEIALHPAQMVPRRTGSCRQPGAQAGHEVHEVYLHMHRHAEVDSHSAWPLGVYNGRATNSSMGIVKMCSHVQLMYLEYRCLTSAARPCGARCRLPKMHMVA